MLQPVSGWKRKNVKFSVVQSLTHANFQWPAAGVFEARCALSFEFFLFLASKYIDPEQALLKEKVKAW